MKKFIFCIDSDGCAMDTMTVKHEEFFGPLAVEFFNVKDVKNFINKWNEINLYSETRGINRFKGLVLALKSEEEVNSKNLDGLYSFVENAKVLSNKALEDEIKINPDPTLIAALNWSKKVNSSIEKNLTGKDRPFENVLECLKLISEKCDIAIVSSANRAAIESEWKRHGLIPFVNYVFGQEDGTKEYVISEIIKKGYDKDNVIMVGDAPGDERAAFHNNIKFFPIVIRQESKSWEKLANEGLNIFINGNFSDKYQNDLLAEFHNALKIGGNND